jgi:hypothetical membrane protein
MRKNRIGAFLGISAVVLLICSLIVFSILNSEFDLFHDFISKLGALGQPYAIWWNIIGFVGVGMLLFGFGLLYGKIIKDRWVGIFLCLFGIGFGFTSIPVDLHSEQAAVSKAHIVAICVGLAFWMFALSRIGMLHRLDRKTRILANAAASLIGITMIGFMAGWWSMPVTHRLIFATVFGWTAVSSIELFRKKQAVT